MAALTLTSLIPTIYNAMDTISRERTGFIRAVGRDSGAERAAKGEVVMSPVVGALSAEDLTVGNVSADYPAQTITNVQMTISKSRSVPFGITGEEMLGLRNAGTYDQINRDRIAQALRTLGNEIETDLAALHVNASRAYGTATATPFGTINVLTDFAQAKKILEENGAPASDLHMILGSTSVARIRGVQASLFKVNEAGSDDLLRTGALGTVQDFAIGYSPAVPALVTVGTGSSATTDSSGYSVGDTEITLASAGTGTIIAGDIITFAADTNQYLVKTGDTDVSDGGTVVLQEPGLKIAIASSATAITTTAATTRNMFFHRGALQLATRAPAMPEGGDNADDVMVITDPVTGISYEFVVYKQKRQVRYEVNLAWGVAAPQPRHIGLLNSA